MIDEVSPGVEGSSAPVNVLSSTSTAMRLPSPSVANRYPACRTSVSAGSTRGRRIVCQLLSAWLKNAARWTASVNCVGPRLELKVVGENSGESRTGCTNCVASITSRTPAVENRGDPSAFRRSMFTGTIGAPMKVVSSSRLPRKGELPTIVKGHMSCETPLVFTPGLAKTPLNVTSESMSDEPLPEPQSDLTPALAAKGSLLVMFTGLETPWGT